MIIPSTGVLFLVVTVILSACGEATWTSAPTPNEGTMVKPCGVIVIQGIFDPSGEKLLRLDPIRLYPRPSAQILQQQKGVYVAKVTYTTGDVTTVPFDARIADDLGRTVHGFFEVEVPVCDKIVSVLITDASGGEVFARIDDAEILK